MNLLPCPFCGSEEVAFIVSHGSSVICNGCNIKFLYDARKDGRGVMCQWNTRHSPWISVKDRLPKKNGRYLVIEDHHSNWTGICKFSNGKFELKVTHWMPLPSLTEEKCE